jgi:lipase
MDRATSFTRLMARLPEWSIVAYDRRGYARSHYHGPPDSFDVQVQDLLDVVGDAPVVAFGHSFGGDVVLAAADRHPGVITAAVIWEPPQPWMPWWPAASTSRGAHSDLEPADHAERFMRRMVGDRIWERLPSATQAARRAEGVTMRAEIATLGAGPVFQPSAIRVPVIVGRGGRSSVHQRRGVRELAASLPDGELAEIPAAGHGAHLTHPAELAGLIRKVAAASRPMPA